MDIDNNYEYKASDLDCSDDKQIINELCNEYGFNFGSTRKIKVDEFDKAYKLKHFNFDNHI